MIYFSTILISILVTTALIPVFTALALRLQLVDVPSKRKVHQVPVPRCGGLAMAIGAVLPILFWLHRDSFVRAFTAGAGVLVLFGFMDDLKELGPKTKFFGQIIAALIVMFFDGVRIRSLGMLAPDGFIIPEWAAIPLTIVVIVGVTNAINLADGLDGLAGGVSLLIFCCIGYLAYGDGNSMICLVSLAMIGSIFGFLRYNTFPATVFMGDTGSQLLGFSAISMALTLTQGKTALSPLLPLVLLGFPILDTLNVMTTRVAQGRSPFSADKSHFHHNLLKLGLFHPESVLIIYAIQAFLVVAAYTLRYQSEWLLLGGYIGFSLSILAFFAVATGSRGHFERNGFFDRAIKERLRRLKNEGIIIRSTFRIFENGIPLLLLGTCLLPRETPYFVAAGALGFAGAIVAIWFCCRKRMGDLLRLTLYIIIPFAVYQSDVSAPVWMNGLCNRLYNLVFGLFALFIIIISKFSRRTEGFRSTPLDFLIIFIVVMLVRLPVGEIGELHFGLITARVLLLYFSYEVMMSELRGRFGRVAVLTCVALVVTGMKGLMM